MNYNIRYETSTGQIISAGFTDFTAELQSGEAQADSGSDTIPSDITKAWTYVNGELVNTPPPAPPLTLDQQLAQATGGLITSVGAAAAFLRACQVSATDTPAWQQTQLDQIQSALNSVMGTSS